MKVLMTVLIVVVLGVLAYGLYDTANHLHEFGLRGIWCGQRGCP